MSAVGERQFKQGDHICAIYDDDEEQLTIAASYVIEGIRCRERCLYVASSDGNLNRFRRLLEVHGVDPVVAEANGSLVLQTAANAHLASGSFSSEMMLRLLNDMVESALNDGFVGLRTCGDMSWLLGDPPGAEQIVEYEALLNPFFQGVRALGMCQYDRRRLPPRLLDQALATHQSVAINETLMANPFYRRRGA